MSEVGYLRGNQAAALAAKLSRIQLMGAYPSPPSSEIMEAISTYIQEGKLDAAFIEVEGEKSAQLACFAAASTGVRAFNATSSQGILYMNEALHLQSGSRVPMVMVVGTRSVFAPHSMKCDHTDSMSQRDTGWLQIYCETVQEVLDTVIQGYKIAEDGRIMLPMMVCEDGYYTTHSLERVLIPTQEAVDSFLPPYEPGETHKVEPGGLSLFTSFGVMENWFTEFKYQERVAMETAKDVIEEVDEDFAEQFGRSYGGLSSTGHDGLHLRDGAVRDRHHAARGPEGRAAQGPQLPAVSAREDRGGRRPVVCGRGRRAGPHECQRAARRGTFRTLSTRQAAARTWLYLWPQRQGRVAVQHDRLRYERLRSSRKRQGRERSDHVHGAEARGGIILDIGSD
jgi:hypothetical protein